jgi:hypothetical protein
MANSFETTAYVLDEVFIRFVNYLSFAKVANRNLEEDFKTLKYATGQTLNYRLEERYLAQEGATAVEEARVQVIRPLSINKQFHTMVAFTGMELTFDRARDKPYLDMMLNPRAKALANKVEKFIATDNLQLKVYQAVGTSGVPIDFDVIAIADAYMTELGIPEDGNRYLAVPPRASAALSIDLKGSFNSDINRGALMDGFIGHLSGFDIFKSNFLTRHTAGVGEVGAGAPTGFHLAGVITANAASGSTLQANGYANNTLVFKKGDLLQVAEADGVFMVNPLIYDALSTPAQFVVTADVTSDGFGAAVIPVSPEIIISGARQNISGQISIGDQLIMRDSFNRAIAFHNQAIVFAAPPISELKGGVEVVTTYSDLYKLAITYSLGADIRNYVQLDRLDCLSGCEINPEFAVVVVH